MNTHPTPETIAQLYEQTLADDDRERVLQHIASCDTCFSEYEALVREFAPGGLHDATPSSRPLRTGPARPAAIAALAAAAAIIVVAGWALRQSGSTSPYRSGSTVSPVLVAAVKATSSAGPILPGGQGGVAGGVFRSGPEPDPALSAALDALSDTCEEGDVSCIAWMASGLVAADRLDAADLYLRRAGAAARTHPDLLIVRGVIDYRRSDLQDAVQAFRQAVEAEPSSAIARFNLALALTDGGDAGEAAEHLRWVAEHADDDLAARAAAALEVTSPAP